MKNTEVLMKRIAIYVTIFLFTILILSINLLAQEQNDKKKDKDKKEMEELSKISSIKSDNSKGDYILPEEEKLYEKGDEDIYKTIISPVHQKDGIKTGVLLYYGHFVKPPYKIEVSYVNKECKIMVNGLNVSEGDKKVGGIRGQVLYFSIFDFKQDEKFIEFLEKKEYEDALLIPFEEAQSMTILWGR